MGVKALTDDSVTKTVVESSHPTHVTGQGGTLHHGVLTDVVEHTVVCEVTLMGGRGEGEGERRRGGEGRRRGEEGRRGGGRGGSTNQSKHGVQYSRLAQQPSKQHNQ